MTVSAQTGGPIGGPVGSPTGANGANGAVGGYQQGSRGALSAPSTNWSSGRQAGKGSFGIDRRNQSYNSYNAARPQVQEQQPALRKLPRQNRPATTIQDTRRIESASTGNRRRFDEPINIKPVTRKVASKETSSIDHYRDLVQQGMLAESGFNGRIDHARAQNFYCEAARGGYPDAMIRLGWIHEEGKGVPRNHDIAATLFQRAALFGSDLGRDLSSRYKATREALPACLKGSIVEKGTPERAASATELAAFGQQTARSTNPVVGAARAKIVKHVVAEARKYKLDPRLVLAVMSAESAFNPNARSERNAFGLMQIIPETAERFGVTDILDPIQNIRGGMAYLRWLLNYFQGDVSLVLAAYNAGEGAVDRHNGVPPFAETLAYVQRIRAAYPFDYHPYDPRAGTSTSTAAKPAPKPASAAISTEALATQIAPRRQ